jgi:adenylosuccinate lyase
MAHTVIAFKSLLKGLEKLVLNPKAIQTDLQKNWAVITEGIQTILRREGYPEPYEALKALTRTHSRIDRQSISEFIEKLDVAPAVKEELKRLTPENYTGVYDF